MHHSKRWATAVALTLAMSPAFAGMGDMSGSGMGGMNGGGSACTQAKTVHGVMGVHEMGGVVTAVNHHTGLLSLKTGMGVLRLHFPPKTLAQVKTGEHLVVHLGFTVGH